MGEDGRECRFLETNKPSNILLKQFLLCEKEAEASVSVDHRLMRLLVREDRQLLKTKKETLCCNSSIRSPIKIGLTKCTGCSMVIAIVRWSCLSGE